QAFSDVGNPFMFQGRPHFAFDTAGISPDVDGDGIPDECAAGNVVDLPNPATATPEAYATFYEWCLMRSWGPGPQTTCGEQFHRLVEKQRELGLPPRRP
ncbi:MAG: hypothetical protein ACE5E1_08050, partial [Phycisphaerae bacterium]